MYIMSNIIFRLLGVSFAAILVSPVAAQTLTPNYPNRPIKIVVPYVPGGGVDTAARVTGQKMNELTGQPVIIENKPGAGTNIGSDFVAKAPADGYTLLLSNSSQVANATMYGKAMTYDLLRDLAPVTMIGTTPVLLVVHPSLPVKTARDLIALARAKPGQLTFASAGIGSPTHIAPELFKWMAKIDMLHVPYKGGSQAVTDVIGLPGYELVGWFALMLPSATPAEVVSRVNAVAVQALRAPGMKERLLSEGTEVVASTPQDFDAFTRRELTKYEKLVKAANIKPE